MFREMGMQSWVDEAQGALRGLGSSDQLQSVPVTRSP